jgi:hypothetical protein
MIEQVKQAAGGSAAAMVFAEVSDQRDGQVLREQRAARRAALSFSVCGAWARVDEAPWSVSSEGVLPCTPDADKPLRRGLTARVSPPQNNRLISTQHCRSFMKAQLALVSLFAALAVVSAPASAKGCLKGAAVGGVGGHFVGHHGLLGAGIGCAVGMHRANKADKAAGHTQRVPANSKQM